MHKMKSVVKYRILCFVSAFLTCFVLYLCLPTLKHGYDGFLQKISARNTVFNAFMVKEVKFLRILKKAGVSPILIEPRLLLYLLSDSEHSMLKERKIIIAKPSRNQSLTTYGIFESNSTNISENLIERLKANGYEYEKTESLDARHFHWDNKKCKNVTITGHHFFVKSYHVYHLLVLYTRGEFLWSSAVGSLPSAVARLVKLEDISIGQYASGFENFEISTFRFGNNVVLVPSDIKQFLFEIPNSQFVECNHSAARRFYEKYWEEGKPNESFDKKTINAIKAVKELTKSFMIPFWICSGTLLGWYRQCNVIPYTTDVDLASWATDFSSSFEEQARKNLNKLNLKYVYGIPEESYQYAFYYSGLRVDFFFTYKGKDIYYYGGHMPSNHKYFHYNYPKFNLCSADLLGNKVLVPCSSEQVLTAEYGVNWTIPIKHWSYHLSAFNIGEKVTWPSSIIKKTYRTY